MNRSPERRSQPSHVLGELVPAPREVKYALRAHINLKEEKDCFVASQAIQLPPEALKAADELASLLSVDMSISSRYTRLPIGWAAYELTVSEGQTIVFLCIIGAVDGFSREEDFEGIATSYYHDSDELLEIMEAPFRLPRRAIDIVM